MTILAASPPDCNPRPPEAPKAKKTREQRRNHVYDLYCAFPLSSANRERLGLLIHGYNRDPNVRIFTSMALFSFSASLEKSTFFRRVPVSRVRLMAKVYIARALGKLGDIAGFSSLEWLQNIKKSSNLIEKISGYKYKSGKAREVLLVDPEDPVMKEIMRIVEEELRTPASEKINPVFAVSGLPWTQEKCQANMIEKAEIARIAHEKALVKLAKTQSDPDRPPSEYAEAIVDYYANSCDDFYFKYLEFIPEYIKAIYDDPNLTNEQKDKKSKLLHSLNTDQIIPRYYQKEDQRGYGRFWQEGIGFQNLPADIRSGILGRAETRTADLKCFNPTIAGQILDIAEIKEITRAGGSLWHAISQQIGAPELTGKLKSALKPALNSVLGNAKKATIQEYLKSLPKKQRIGFFESPLIRKLTQESQRTFRQIRRDRGITLLDGVFIPLKSGDNPATLLAYKMQHLELVLIAACYRYAADKRDQFIIVSHEHDGFTFELVQKDQESQIVAGLKAAVAAEAARWGLVMQLELK